MFNREYEYLILQREKNGYNDWQDITSKVAMLEDDGRAYAIKYVGSYKTYHKSFSDIQVFNNPAIVDISDKVVCLNGSMIRDVVKVLRFDRWYKIFSSSGYHRTANSSKVQIIDRVSELQKGDVFAYLKEVASQLISEDGEHFLYNQLENMIVLEESVLCKLLDNKLKKQAYNDQVIYPFSTNLSQMEAVEKALTNDLSIIQGPPGTGKTQTILNIIANYVCGGKSVAVLSGNNEAIKNVYQKLADNGYDYINALLGNNENIISFFNDRSKNVPSIKSNSIPYLYNLECTLRENNDNIKKAMQYQVDIANLKRLIVELDVEYSNQSNQISYIDENIPECIRNAKLSSKKILELIAYFELQDINMLFKPSKRLKLFFYFKIRKLKSIIPYRDDIISYLRLYYYVKKKEEVEKEIRDKEKFLAENNAEELTQSQESTSKAILDIKLKQKYDKIVEQDFTKSNYRYKFKDFVNRYPVVYSTTNSIRQCSNDTYLYDCIIIDESSQVDLITATIALSCAKRVVLVGDEMQLTHIVEGDLKGVFNEIFAKYDLPDYFNYTKYNILGFVKRIKEDIPSTLLNEHYRCDSQIIDFCNKMFYDNKLVVHTKHEEGNGVQIIEHGSHLCRGRTNEGQAEIIENEVLPLLDDTKVGIIAPYREQVNLLQNKFRDTNCVIDTVHKFQGKEKDYIILSTVSNKVMLYKDEEKVDFLNNRNLINVAISRAKKKLFVLASREMLKQENTLMYDLVEYYKYYCDDKKIEHTNIYSVFDLMYDDYEPILEEMKKSLLKISEFDSENIIATIIKDICEGGKYGCLDFKFNYPLKYVVKQKLCSNERDVAFLNNINTHCDFVIFNKLNKEIKLVIEVDGKQHDQEVQRERDEIKDRLLSAANIKLLRLQTSATQCKEKIIAMLSQDY